jgi:hypothetical protein
VADGKKSNETTLARNANGGFTESWIAQKETADRPAKGLRFRKIKLMRHYTSRFRNQTTKPAPTGMRRELLNIIFDGWLDATDRASVEVQLRAVALNPAELAAALRRFDTHGLSRAGVTL